MYKNLVQQNVYNIHDAFSIKWFGIFSIKFGFNKIVDFYTQIQNLFFAFIL